MKLLRGNQIMQLVAMDFLGLESMKNAAKCDISCETHINVNHR